jgi:hypothetical protein
MEFTLRAVATQFHDMWFVQLRFSIAYTKLAKSSFDKFKQTVCSRTEHTAIGRGRGGGGEGASNNAAQLDF